MGILSIANRYRRAQPAVCGATLGRWSWVGYGIKLINSACLCFLSLVLLEFLPYLPTVMDEDLEVEVRLTLSSPNYLWLWCFVTATEKQTGREDNSWGGQSVISFHYVDSRDQT